MTSLALRDVEVRLGAFHLELDLTLELGCTGIFGPSGSGKTTLLEIITGLRAVRRGRVTLDGETLADAATGAWIPPHQRRIGYVPQDLALFPHLDVRANILYGAPRHAARDDTPSVDALTDLLELTPLLGRRVQGLSGGERQRVALARALAARPRLLLLDEPLTGLDQARKDHVLDYLRLLRERWAVPMLYVSHQPDELTGLCDEVVVLRGGAVAARGRPLDVFEPSGRPSYRLRPALCTLTEDGHVEEA
ncbi:MAG: ATP-binding cassette domain-containing protein [Verrucomicrobiota bacterium]